MRLFVALWPDAAVRAAIASRRDAIAWPAGTRATPDDKLHITLHFIGSWPAAALSRLTEALAAVPPGPAFELELGPVAAWPNGLVVLLARTVPPPLSDLHSRLSEALRSLGVEIDRRRLRPHVTLARHGPRRIEAPAWPPLRWAVQGFALVESAAGRYRVVAGGP
ncbi:MAG: RNA 2',3'-cyclic phosphodiesterase [Rubrivivax sp.]|nr:RNA 2',3'-cyclic phosphodiesterase [Rubrivivax sp.]